MGAMSHIVFHSLIKNALFLCAGTVIVMTGKTRVEDLKGLGVKMPLFLSCYTVVSLALIGIPPTSGFVSKWYLATGSLQSNTPAFAGAGPVFRWLGPAVLLVSALLTAGYLLPLTIQGFFPGEDYKEHAKSEPSAWMMGPILLLTAGALLLGCFPGRLLAMVEKIAASTLL